MFEKASHILELYRKISSKVSYKKHGFSKLVCTVFCFISVVNIT